MQHGGRRYYYYLSSNRFRPAVPNNPVFEGRPWGHYLPPGSNIDAVWHNASPAASMVIDGTRRVRLAFLYRLLRIYYFVTDYAIKLYVRVVLRLQKHGLTAITSFEEKYFLPLLTWMLKLCLVVDKKQTY